MSRTYTRPSTAADMRLAADRMPKKLLILGTRGVPARHGGFETFAEQLCLYLVERNWEVTVYCQARRSRSDISLGNPIIDDWKGVRRITFDIQPTGAFGTMMFDWACVQHALGENGLPLVLGYNTALFNVLFRMKGRPLLMNMDGIEWKRAKWPIHAKLWLYINEHVGCWISTRLIADHPEIAEHLSFHSRRSKIVTIPYGAVPIDGISDQPVRALGLAPRGYFLSIGRIEPENSLLEIIEAYVAEPREAKLICLGRLEPARSSYHAKIVAAACNRVMFPGAIYDPEIVRSLRFHALAYLHGHTAGGTNPSLVEALGAGSAVLAHDNKFNRWVAGPEQLYFSDAASLRELFKTVELSPWILQHARDSARERFQRDFTLEKILGQYEGLCSQVIGV